MSKIYVICHNVRSRHNIGSIFRTADGAGVSKIFLCGITPSPPHPNIEKVSLGAENFVEWEKSKETWRVIEKLKKENFEIVALEQAKNSISLDQTDNGCRFGKKHAGGRRKRGRGAENKVPVFGVKKRDDGRVYTQIIKNASKQELLPIIRRLVAKDNTTVYTDKWRSYDGLVLDGYKHKRINHSKTYSNRKGTHVNGIENFWSFAKRRLAKFNGVSRKTFLLHMEECEFRYNHKNDILNMLQKITKDLLV